jgi:glycosidase
MCDDELKRCEHVFTYTDAGETSVEVRGTFAPNGWTEGVPMTKSGAVWSASIEVPWTGETQYKFVLNGTTWIEDPVNPIKVNDNNGGFNSVLKDVMCEEWTCAPSQIGTFDWRDAIMYFVFVDRFLDGNMANNGPAIPGVLPPAAYRGGDWAGVLQKVNDNYFNELGVNTLWLSVPMDNPGIAGLGADGKQYSAYHGYWPGDLTKTEERFGTLAELKALVDAAHAKGLKVIVDYAMNHVHKDSPVYQDHPDWFWPLSDASVQNCVCGDGCDWNGQQGKRCWFRDYLPDFNFTNATARAFSVNNAVQWIKDTGIDGFRLDAVKHIEDAWLLDLRAKVKAEIEPVTNEHFYMVGETFDGDKSVIKYYVNPSMLDGQFDFPLRADIVSAVLIRSLGMDALDNAIAANEGYYGAGIMSTFVGNHDIPRPIHFAEDVPLWNDPWNGGKDKAWDNTPPLPSGQSAFERLANAFTILFTLKGVPLVYYGDEIGMPGAGDPDNRRPMQWTGYSAGQTLLLTHLKKLGKIRADHPALRRGKRTNFFKNAAAMGYTMAHNADTVHVLVNRDNAQQVISNVPAGSYQDLLTGASQSGPSITVPPRSSMILFAQ